MEINSYDIPNHIVSNRILNSLCVTILSTHILIPNTRNLKEIPKFIESICLAIVVKVSK